LKISVVTVCFNAADTIAYTIDSCLEQSHLDREILVIDGGSTDGTIDIVERYAQDGVRLVTGPDKGMYDAINKSLRLYTGDAIGFLNADDRYHGRDVLSAIDHALREADIVSGHLDFVSDHASRAVVRRWRGTPYRRGAFRRGWMPAHPTFYVRRAVVDAVGQYDLAYRVASDYDWMLRAHELHHFRTVVIDKIMVDMMAGGASTVSLRSHVRHNLEALAARRRWLNSGLVDYALVAKPLRKLGQFRLNQRKPPLPTA